MIISKTSDKFKEFKDRIKSPNKYKYSTITDDLQVLEIALKFDLEIEILLPAVNTSCLAEKAV